MNFVLSTTPFETLLESFETNVHDFLTFVIKVCGVEQQSETFQYLRNNINTMDDVSKFIECFDGNIDGIEETTALYQTMAH